MRPFAGVNGSTHSSRTQTPNTGVHDKCKFRARLRSVAVFRPMLAPEHSAAQGVTASRLFQAAPRSHARQGTVMRRMDMRSARSGKKRRKLLPDKYLRNAYFSERMSSKSNAFAGAALQFPGRDIATRRRQIENAVHDKVREVVGRAKEKRAGGPTRPVCTLSFIHPTQQPGHVGLGRGKRTAYARCVARSEGATATGTRC